LHMHLPRARALQCLSVTGRPVAITGDDTGWAQRDERDVRTV
jgi:hypothetical protein